MRNRYPDHYGFGCSFFRSMGIRIQIQGLDDQKKYNFCSWQNSYLKKSEVAIFWSLGLHKGHPSYRRRLQPSKENIQLIKTWSFPHFFHCLKVLFAFLDRDPVPADQIQCRLCGSEYGSTSLGFGSVWSPWSLSWSFSTKQEEFGCKRTDEDLRAEKEQVSLASKSCSAQKDCQAKMFWLGMGII
jgi:hypothetical protein